MNAKGQRYKIKRPKVVADRLANTIGDIPLKQLYIVVQEASGLPQKQIAANLGISPKAIDWHLRKFREVTGLGCIALRTRWAIRNGLIAACLALTCLATNGRGQPTLPKLVAPSDTVEVKLNWEAVKGAEAYRVFYGTNSGNYFANTTFPGGNVTNATLLLPRGPVYYFAAKAQAGFDESDYSNEAVYGLVGPTLNLSVYVLRLDWQPIPGKTNVLQSRLGVTGNWNDLLTVTTTNRQTQLRTNNGSGEYYRVIVK